MQYFGILQFPYKFGKIILKMDLRLHRTKPTSDEGSLVRYRAGPDNSYDEVTHMNADFAINELILETERLILRPFQQSDLRDFYEYASVPGVGEMAGWQHHESIEKSQEILDLFIREDKTFAIVCKENNKVIGSLGVEKYGMEDALTEFVGYKGREIGFVLSKDYWGRGMMPEAVTAVMDYLFNDLSLDFLTCGYYDFNSQSKCVQVKCGFQPYRKLNMDTRLGTTEPGVLNLLTNPNKDISFVFSHPETLIYQTK